MSSATSFRVRSALHAKCSHGASCQRNLGRPLAHRFFGCWSRSVGSVAASFSRPTRPVAHSLKLSEMARPEGSIGPEPQRVSGVYLWQHLPFKGVLGPTQCTTTRIDSLSLMNLLEAGALGDPALAGKQFPIPKKRPRLRQADLNKTLRWP